MAKINVRDRNKNKPDKKPNWEYRFEAARVDGKRKHISKSGFKTKKEALEAGALAMSEYNTAGLHFEPSEIGVNDYLDYWYEQYCVTNLKYNTLLTYQHLIKKHIKPYLGMYKLKSLNPSVLQDYANELSKKGYSISYVFGILSTLKVALDYAVFPLKYIRDNPITYIKFPTNGKRKRAREVISRDEFEKIMQRFPFGNRFHIPLLFGWYCGLRISEAFAVTWNDIDFENKTLNIDKQLIKRSYSHEAKAIMQYRRNSEKSAWYFAPPKYDSCRVIKIGDNLIDVLRREKQRQEENEKLYNEYYTNYVSVEEIDEKGNSITRIVPIPKCIETTQPRINFVCVEENGLFSTTDTFKYASRVIQGLIETPFDFHSLRHSHATLLIENGVSPKAVQQRLGHRSIVTTLQTYVKATEHMQQEAADAFEEIMAAPVTPPAA